ncbi:MAG: hypothetical protein JJ891_12675 [Rhizobiaceae bacterium]|nr:hypothetical protein [Rhizobiaceae bacterium]
MTHDQINDATFLVVPLSTKQLLQAARLAGLEVHLEIDWNALSNEESECIQDYARYGVLEAIRESFERHWPEYYPDDFEQTFWGDAS